MIYEKIAKILAEYKEMDAGDISADTSFEELELDSLDTVELLMRIEDELSVSLELEEGLKTVGDIVKAVEARKDGGNA